MKSGNNITMSNRQQGRKETIRLLLSTREAAQALAISQRTLWQLTKDGEIESIKVGKRSVRYPVSALNKWIAEQVEKGA